MEVVFKSNKLRKKCNSLKEAQKKWGTRQGVLILRRLNEMMAAVNLRDLKLVHPRCHDLKGSRGGQWSVDLVHPYRLLFEPANEPLPLLKDGGLDISQVTIVRILEVQDTHGH